MCWTMAHDPDVRGFTSFELSKAQFFKLQNKTTRRKLHTKVFSFI